MFWKRVTAALGAAIAVGAVNAQTPSSPATDWATVSRFLALVNVFVQAASASCPPGATSTQGCDPDAAQRAFDDIVNGRNPEANAVMLDIFAGVPQPEREKMLAIGRSMAAMSRKQTAAVGQTAGEGAAIRARKDLAQMGLVYHDPAQFIDAVKRKDAIAVRLFLSGRGVDPDARDAWGVSALELAKRGGDAEIIALVSAAQPR
jgi:hypothetical protein